MVARFGLLDDGYARSLGRRPVLAYSLDVASMRKAVEDLVLGDVIVNPFADEKAKFALVVYMGPCDTIPKPEANFYVEPQLRFLVHQRDDRWLMSHGVSYVCLRKGDPIDVYDEVRVQYPERRSKFVSGDELRQAVANIHRECA